MFIEYFQGGKKDCSTSFTDQQNIQNQNTID